MPTSLLLGVLQACLLGAKDSVTPLVAVVYATVVNVVGDYIAVTRLGLGLKGAALATTLAQWASTYALLGPARKVLVKDHNLGLTSNKHRKNSVEGAVTGKSFLAFAAPVLTLILGKLAAFGFMTHAAAALPGQPTTLASHQIILSTFFFISPFLEVISQTAQTFLPPYVSPVREYINFMKQNDFSYDVELDKVAQNWLRAAFTMATRLLGIGVVVASFVATLVSLIPAFFGNWITSDIVVQQAVKPLAKFLWVGALLTAPVAVSEGVLLAQRELPFLASVYVVSTIILPFALIEIKKRSGPVWQVWGCFAAFQLFRATCFAGRIWGGAAINAFRHQLHVRRSKKEENPAIAAN
jgi:Na+-driven multidrug efflux pump